MLGGLRSRVRFTLDALAVEDELNLAFIVGQHVEKISALRDRRPYRGALLRLAIFFFHLFSNMRARRAPKVVKDFFFYSDTQNQYSSLRGTYCALPTAQTFSLLSPALHKVIRTRDAADVTLRFSSADVAVALIVFVVRFPGLYRRLRQGHEAALHNFLNFFCMPYVYIPAFLRLLEGGRVFCVIQSNDHNVTNRSLRLVAERLGIKNAYMQHASVSTLFPALQYDYAFLDGVASLEIYEQCAAQQAFRGKKGYIYLTGQKKQFETRSDTKNYIAIAVNALDEAPQLIRFLERLKPLAVSVSIRMHPAQRVEFIGELKRYAAGNDWVSLHAASERSLADFFAGAYFLVAANSSIHLEAIICGLVSYYREFSAVVERADYYGYLRGGLVEHFPDEDELSIISLIKRYPPVEAVRYFSSTYGTIWQGREGELAAECLQRIRSGAGMQDIFRVEESNPIGVVYSPH